MTADQLRSEVANAKDPILAITLFLGEHMQEDVRIHGEMTLAIENLGKKIQPIADVFSATGFLRSIGGWFIALVAGVILSWQYFLNNVRDVIK